MPTENDEKNDYPTKKEFLDKPINISYIEETEPANLEIKVCKLRSGINE